MAEKSDIVKSKLAGYAMYPSVHRPQKDEDNNKYTFKVDLVLVDLDTRKPVTITDTKTGESVNMLKRAKELGLNIKTADPDSKMYEQIGDAPFVRIKRDVPFLKLEAAKDEEAKKKLMAPVPVKFRKGFKAIGEDTMIGNKSLVVVDFSAIPWERKVKNRETGKVELTKGVTAYLFGMSVVKLVSYQKDFDKDTFDFDGVEMTDPNEVEEDTGFAFGSSSDDNESEKDIPMSEDEDNLD